MALFLPTLRLKCHRMTVLITFPLSSGDSLEYVNNLITQELKDHKYVQASFKPHYVHAIGPLTKPDSKFHPITDCKRPIGSSINNYMNTT